MVNNNLIIQKKEESHFGSLNISYSDKNLQHKSPFVVSVTSGKGGVGKTLTSIILSLVFKRLNKSILLVDGDVGLANVDIVLGIESRYNINDIIQGNATIKDIVLEGPLGLQIIPSGSGISQLTQLSYLQRLHLLEELKNLNERFDTIFIDTGAGISQSVMYFNKLAHVVVVVTTSEPHALTDAYSTIKVLREEYGKENFAIIINMTKNNIEGEKTFNRLANTCNKFLKIQPTYLGDIPYDSKIAYAVALRRIGTRDLIYTTAGQAWNQAAYKLADLQQMFLITENVWDNILWSS